ncbi:hypothetical protein GCM10022271_18320 [Corallibacter vietnamensis]|uniref:AlgX/AlgJ SGNH hydrolase-like domain-containing protein n=1 Tax=Corallibacter vietnamensis TaxID=904130 RepID=A0ABP7H609_9FLAO
MKNRLHKIFITVSIVMISIPLVLVLLKIKVEPKNPGEKKISLNFKRNFPLKADLFEMYCNIKANFLKVNPVPNSVIDLNNGWKFLGNDYSNALTESKGIQNFNKEQLETIKTNLLENKKWIEDHGIKFYLSIAPNKHSIYGDMIPIAKSNKKTKLEQIKTLCKNIDIPFIDLGAYFPKDSIRLYHRTDSHWNYLGGYYASKAIINSLSKDYKTQNFNNHPLSDYEIERFNSPIGDLNGMLFLKKNEEVITIKPKFEYSWTKQANQLPLPSPYHFDPKDYEHRYTSDVNDLKIIIMRDSFFVALQETIANNFGETLCIWRHNFDKTLMKNEKPDIVLYEIVERNIDVLLNDDFDHASN